MGGSISTSGYFCDIVATAGGITTFVFVYIQGHEKLMNNPMTRGRQYLELHKDLLKQNWPVWLVGLVTFLNGCSSRKPNRDGSPLQQRYFLVCPRERALFMSSLNSAQNLKSGLPNAVPTEKKRSFLFKALKLFTKLFKPDHPFINVCPDG